MLVRYTTTYADFKHAQRLHILHKPFGLVRYVVFLWIVPVLGTVAALLLLWDTTIRHFQFPPWLAGILAGLAWLGVTSAIARPFTVRRGYKLMKNGRSDADPLELELHGTELISRIPGRSEGSLLSFRHPQRR